jgi:hypothetical protein
VSGRIPGPRLAPDDEGQPAPPPPLGRLWARPCARCGCSRYAHAHDRGGRGFTVAGCAVCGCRAFTWPQRRFLADLPGARFRTRFLLGYMRTAWDGRYDIGPSYAGWTATPLSGEGTTIRAPGLVLLQHLITADWDERVLRQKRRDALMAALAKVGGRPDA